ncbi:Metallo-dependent hydrolase [Ascodesmis nigricans]|uniref:adenosine deaminase n=1 Tax=Ascodesmis nigricans TaxID=341454 RepID=A0A4S2N7W9_9PEZI|nr:Metallo-dependent hydrolase [Ascodesmis nigricans]
MTASNTGASTVDISRELAAHYAARAKLQQEEKALRHDFAFIQSLSPTARKAAEVVRRIRAHETSTIWKKEEASAHHVFPGMSFTLAKQRIEQTKLWRIVRKLPKGALLHAHLEAMVDMGWLLDRALETEGICIFAPAPLDSPTALATVIFEFSSPTTIPKDAANIWTSAYVPNTPIPLRTAVQTFRHAHHTSFQEWFLSRTTITPAESLLQHEGVTEIWRKFQTIFIHISPLVFHPEIFPAFVHRILADLYDDSIYWSDIRMAFLPETPSERLVGTFEKAVTEFKAKHPNFWGASLIFTIPRSVPDEMIDQLSVLCIKLKQAHPSTISAFDCVGFEDAGRSLLDLTPCILRFKALCKAANVDIPVFLHAGETLLSSVSQNLLDAVLLDVRRIGHGYSLYRHPRLVQLVKEKNILLEICPISNEVLRLAGTILQHPIPAYLAAGVACAIGCDDPGILGQHDGCGGNGGMNGMKEGGGGSSHDFWQLLQGFDEVGLEGLGDLAQNSVQWAAFEGVASQAGILSEGGIREERIKLWRKEWEQFCEWVVAEFGEEWLKNE